MGGSSSSTTNTNQTSQLTPYAPAAAGINQLLSGLSPSIQNLNGGAQVQNSLSQLYNLGQQPNTLGQPSVNAAGALLNGSQNYGNATGILNGAYGTTAQALSPYTSGNAMDPSTNPALAQQLATVNQQVQNSVNPMFAAAGRLGSPANAQALAQGIALGDTGILQNGAANQLSAIGQLQNSGLNTASGLLGADTSNANILGQGINGASTAYGNTALGPLLSLQAALQGNQLPIQNASGLAGILGSLGAGFGTQNTTGTQTGQAQESGAQQFGQIAGGLGNLGKFIFGG